ncbi:fungal-specific transcription factor domain-containing protein [Lasiosphaeris hirsuta]|uniref:Fungal-specific transcription factor domain-containing protein n=1 Tax=Lasiosphaeris hirsuta TaxID=260670 RepID=A0AA40AHJ9_9PEZI|nr:fungal-specific transcription factor domain-containing protein [Lasiosphaeris hirsuta]
MPVPRRTSISKGDSMSGQPRQQPGSACEECRKRKLRCDRQRPQCGTCADAGIVCEVNNNRLARGPKKGDLKALRSRIVALERRLSLDQTGELVLLSDADMPPLDEIPRATTSTASDGEQHPPYSHPRPHPHLHPQLPTPPERKQIWESEIHDQVPPMTPVSAPLALPPFKFPPSPASPPKKRALIDDLMRADLDQLYFDRVHPNVPIFNQSRYFAQSRQTVNVGGPNYKLCLQYAMWTLAMALSSQFETSRDHLYNETRHMLEVLDLSDDDMGTVRIEQVQAWLLIAYYEFARANYRRGWVSAGRAFRLVQLARLHEVDSPEGRFDNDDPVMVEERRRTFWVAYCLDRFICIRSRWPLTLAEEVICTRLPSPELAFQGGHPIQVCFLSEAIASNGHNLLSPLAECAILATICGRAMSHCQVSNVERAYGGPSLDFWLRHEWLDGMITKRLEALSANYPIISAVADSMLLFTFMMAQTTIIYLCHIIEGLGAEHQCQPSATEYHKRAVQAAHEIARLSKAHEHIGYFKAHIFLPLTIFFGASRLVLQRNRASDDIEVMTGGFQLLEAENSHGFDDAFQSCMDALMKIQSFNNLAKEHLCSLEGRDFIADYLQC